MVALIEYIDDSLALLSSALLLVPPESAEPDWPAAALWFERAGRTLPTGGILHRSKSRVILVDAGSDPELATTAGPASWRRHAPPVSGARSPHVGVNVWYDARWRFWTASLRADVPTRRWR